MPLRICTSYCKYRKQHLHQSVACQLPACSSYEYLLCNIIVRSTIILVQEPSTSKGNRERCTEHAGSPWLVHEQELFSQQAWDQRTAPLSLQSNSRDGHLAADLSVRLWRDVRRILCVEVPCDTLPYCATCVVCTAIACTNRLLFSPFFFFPPRESAPATMANRPRSAGTEGTYAV